MSEFNAAIFDMDGVIVDNHHYHVEAWRMFCEKYQIEFTESNFRAKYFGKNNYDILNALMNRVVSHVEVTELGEEKEELYRIVYKNHIKPVNGLIELLNVLKREGIKIAIATSAPTSNLNFVVDNLKIRDYFEAIVDATQITTGKPNPEIYLKASELLNILPVNSLVFEDSISGIFAAQRAGMKVISLITTHEAHELPDTELVINDFTEITVEKIRRLF